MNKILKTGRFSVDSAKLNAKLNKKLERLKTNDDTVIEEIYTPLVVKDNNVLVASDWHIPREDNLIIKKLYEVKKEYGVKTLIVCGDFWDVDAYTPFTRYNQEASFRHEIDAVKKRLLELTSEFKNVYFCRGNHENRWIHLNFGMMNMKNLFAITGVTKGYETTMDDHMILNSDGMSWRICHPKEFSKTNLKVPLELSNKHKMNILAAHGHKMGWCLDSTGQYQCVEGGGLFDPERLEYLRNTTMYAAVSSGFWAIRDGWASPFAGRSAKV